jgi:glutamate dehydrogenase
VAEPWLERDLREYFPPAVVDCCGHLLDEHPLRRELICMVNSNAVVNALGPTFVSSLVSERGAEPADVVRAFRIAREVTSADNDWDVIERLEGIDRALQIELMNGMDAQMEATTRWFLNWEPERDIAETISAGRDGFARLSAVLAELGTEERRARREQAVARLEEQGVPAELARAHALRPELVHAPDMVWVSGASGRPIEEVARVFFAVGAELRLDWLEAELARVPVSSRMQRWALQAVREDALQVRRELAGSVLAAGGDQPAAQAVEAFLAERSERVRRFNGFLRSLAREGDPDLPGLTLAVRQLRSIVD